MNVNGRLYFAYVRLRGSRAPAYYQEYLAADRWPSADASRSELARLLRHCRERVPYYAALLRDLPDPQEDPMGVLQRMPVLTKGIIRARFDALKSNDLGRRRWSVNTSGGSTGEPARFVQDVDHQARLGALALAHAHWVGHDLGEPKALLWGSERDVLQGTLGWTKRAANALTRTTFFNAFRMTPEGMRHIAGELRRIRPKLLVAYAQALYELAGFFEAEGLAVPPVAAAITSAGTLYDFMRERIRRVFGCPVYDRYGSREVGLIAAERPGIEGMWVPPRNTIVEIVDEAGRPVPEGTDGDILVTSLTNEAMPLLRYRIGDRGALANGAGAPGTQRLIRLRGRNVDAFRRRDGTIVDGEYFTHLVYFKDWVEKFQFVQTSHDDVVLRIVSRARDRRTLGPELDEMANHVKVALGPTAALRVEWVDEIPPAASGKFRYTISEVAPS